MSWKARMRNLTVALFNDTASYRHVGCRAVGDSTDRMLFRLGAIVSVRYFVDELNWLWSGSRRRSFEQIWNSSFLRELCGVDAVVVNGEGTIHHGHGLHLLSILEVAQHIGKRTYLLNAVIEDCEGFDDVLGRLDDLAVRDQCSLQYLAARNIPARLVADSILGAAFEDGSDSTFAGKIVITDCVTSRTDCLGALAEVANRYGGRAVSYALEGDNALDWPAALRKLRGARLIVTGRHHGVYLALMARVPFVALPSNTWKVEGTLRALGTPDFPYLWSPGADLHALCQSALDDGYDFRPLFDSPFLGTSVTLFDRLAADFSLVLSPPLPDTGDAVRARACQLVLLNKVAQHVKPGDRGLVVGDAEAYSAGMLEKAAERARFAWRTTARVEASALVGDPGDGSADEGNLDMVVVWDEWDRFCLTRDDAGSLLERLAPGGRLVVIGPRAMASGNPTLSNFRCDAEGYAGCIAFQGIETRLYFDRGYLISGATALQGGGIRPPTMGRIDVTEFDAFASPRDGTGFCALVWMKSPLHPGPRGYEERVWPAGKAAGHPSLQYAKEYRFPWLMHALVNAGFRLRSPGSLRLLAEDVSQHGGAGPVDEAAALCVIAYRLVFDDAASGDAVSAHVARIEDALPRLPETPMGVRWNISLCYVRALLLALQGDHVAASLAYEECARLKFDGFGIHIATKGAESWFQAGKQAWLAGDSERATACWRQGLGFGKKLLAVDVADIVMDSERPNLFHHGDGIREYTLAWDSIAKCANGIHLAAVGEAMDFYALETCFDTENLRGQVHIIRAQKNFSRQVELTSRLQADLVRRSADLRQTGDDLRERTGELVALREVLKERTLHLEEALLRNRQVAETTGTVDTDRARIQFLEQALGAKDVELTRMGQELADRSERLARSAGDLVERTRELVDTREIVRERTVYLESVVKALAEKTAELREMQALISNPEGYAPEFVIRILTLATEVEQIKALRNRQSAQFQEMAEELKRRTEELVGVRADLVDRSVRLEGVAATLRARTEELVQTRDELRERTERLETAVKRIQALERRKAPRPAKRSARGKPGTTPSAMATKTKSARYPKATAVRTPKVKNGA